jgi:GT2 family glycosyltransferase
VSADGVRRRPMHAVVVAYNAADHLDSCLAALKLQVPVTVIDNSSSAEVAAVTAAHGASYVDSGANRGFAGGVNLGLSLLACDPVDVLLVNPDAVLRSGAAGALAEFLARPENARVAAVAPRILLPGNIAQRVMWPFPSPLRMWAQAFGIWRLPARRTFAIGAVLLLRCEAIEDVGPFDERFFLYAEETDWQRRACQRDWSSALCVEAVAEHVGAATSTDNRRQEVLHEAGQETYIRKWHGPIGWAGYRAAAFLSAAGLAVILPSRRRRRVAARRALLYLRGPKRVAARQAG